MRYRVRLPQAVRYEPDPWWYTVGQVLLELTVLLVLILGIPFIIWMVWS